METDLDLIGSAWIRINFGCMDADLNQGMQKKTNKYCKKLRNSCFEVLDVFFLRVKASAGACTYFMDNKIARFPVFGHQTMGLDPKPDLDLD